jgi:agmatinase
MLKLPYQLRRSFCAVPEHTTEKIVVAGASFDGATSFRSGSRMGPHAIRDASLMLTDGVHEKFPVDITQTVADVGDWVIGTHNMDMVLTQIEDQHQQLALQGIHVVTLGGDHSITLGILRSLYKIHGKMAVLHFDAHCDTWLDHFGETYGHGTWLRNVIQEQLVDPSQVLSVGLRSPVDSQTRAWLTQQGGHNMSARTAANLTPVQMSQWIQDKLPGNIPVYLSLDIDCLDPAHAPGTGTPEIGGLTTMWLSSVLDNVFSTHMPWVGMDMVEVAPAYDHGQITALAAATFVWQYLSMLSYKNM